MTLVRPPVLRTQLGTGSATSGSDCAAVTVINAIRFASHGLVGPKTQADTAHWVRQVRTWGGAPLTPEQAHLEGRTNAGMLFLTEVLRSYRHPALSMMMAVSGHQLRATYHFCRPWQEVMDSLAAGRLVHLGIDYGVLRAGKASMGSETFNGSHSLALAGYERNPRGEVRTLDGDPLLDGRRPGIPKGWHRSHAGYFRAAAEAWTVGLPDTVTFIDVKRA